jgi:hypothetical protein
VILSNNDSMVMHENDSNVLDTEVERGSEMGSLRGFPGEEYFHRTSTLPETNFCKSLCEKCSRHKKE